MQVGKIRCSTTSREFLVVLKHGDHFEDVLEKVSALTGLVEEGLYAVGSFIRIFDGDLGFEIGDILELKDTYERPF